MILRFASLIALCLALAACSVEAQSINYGSDQCHFCQMTIVDRQHAAQAVSKKGKQYKYDAIECLVNDILKNRSESDIATLMVSDYGQGRMTPARDATYLISKKIKSPMGADLSGFASRERAEATRTEHGGELYSWQTLKERFSQ